MTKERAIEILIERKNTMEYVTDNDDPAFDMAIKALEQGHILDKIRAEIEQTYEQEKEIDKKWAAGLKYSLNIIDKALKEQNK